MSRKRAPEHDWICIRCGCPCTQPGATPQKHVGGGQGMRACRNTPNPMLRGDYEKWVAADVATLRNRNTQ